MTSLEKKRCVPCEATTPPLGTDAITELTQELDTSWKITEGGENEKKLLREFTFPDFATGLSFVNRIGAIAESEGHHPNIVLSWGKVTVELWTHAIGGLSENDFIVAKKIESGYNTYQWKK